MASAPRAPETSILRLSRYHCLLGELMGVRSGRRVTSRELADELGLSEETVRHDLRHVDIEGRPGAGYEIGELYQALQDCLELSELHPFAVVGSADMLRGLSITFPSQQFGLAPRAFFSERAEDIGQTVDGITIASIDEAATLLPGLGVSVAVVACAPESVEAVLDELAVAGVKGVLMLTPVLRPRHPEGMTVTYFRMPCALKSLASAYPRATPDCCATAE